MGKEQTCSKCGAKFNQETGRRAGKLWYCGYCESVIFGTMDARWLPKLGKDEDLPRGYHKL